MDEQVGGGHQRTFAEMGSNDIDDDVSPDETHASFFVAVHTAQTRAEIAIPQMSVCS